MTVTTTDHATWSHGPSEVPSSDFTALEPTGPDAARELDELRERSERLVNGASSSTTPDPDARDRMAAVMYRLTGWPVFRSDEEQDERAYVSRLWAEDWDCDEDAIYDEQ